MTIDIAGCTSVAIDQPDVPQSRHEPSDPLRRWLIRQSIPGRRLRKMGEALVLGGIHRRQTLHSPGGEEVGTTADLRASRSGCRPVPPAPHGSMPTEVEIGGAGQGPKLSIVTRPAAGALSPLTRSSTIESIPAASAAPLLTASNETRCDPVMHPGHRVGFQPQRRQPPSRCNPARKRLLVVVGDPPRGPGRPRRPLPHNQVGEVDRATAVAFLGQDRRLPGARTGRFAARSATRT